MREYTVEYTPSRHSICEGRARLKAGYLNGTVQDVEVRDRSGQILLTLISEDGRLVESARLLDIFLVPILKNDKEARAIMLQVEDEYEWDRRLDKRRGKTSSKTIRELINGT